MRWDGRPSHPSWAQREGSLGTRLGQAAPGLTADAPGPHHSCASDPRQARAAHPAPSRQLAAGTALGQPHMSTTRMGIRCYLKQHAEPCSLPRLETPRSMRLGSVSAC